MFLKKLSPTLLLFLVFGCTLVPPVEQGRYDPRQYKEQVMVTTLPKEAMVEGAPHVNDGIYPFIHLQNTTFNFLPRSNKQGVGLCKILPVRGVRSEQLILCFDRRAVADRSVWTLGQTGVGSVQDGYFVYAYSTRIPGRTQHFYRWQDATRVQYLYGGYNKNPYGYFSTPTNGRWLSL